MALAGNLLQVQPTEEDRVRESSPCTVLFITQWRRPFDIWEMNNTHNLSPTDTEICISLGSEIKSLSFP